MKIRSCLLVSRLWCETSVRILWKNIQNYNTLIACLPNESKEILYKNEVIFPTMSKSPLFNYVTFIKNLSTNEIHREIKEIIILQDCNNYNKFILIIQEVFKMLMNQTCFEKPGFL